MSHEKQLELIYNTINDIVFMLDVDNQTKFKFVSVNKAFERITGVPAREVVNKQVEQIIPAASLDLVLSKYQEAIRTKSTITWEEVSVYPQGEKKGLVTVTPVFNDSGKCIRLIGSVHDITSQKVHEEEMRFANEEKEKLILDLINRNKNLEHFTYIISHNLRAPVANLIGLSAILGDEVLYNNEQKEIVKGIETSVTQLDTVIKDLNYILQKREQSTEQREFINFKQLINDICSGISYMIQQEKVKIDINCGDFDGIYSIRSYLHSIFYNLIVNSIKYKSVDRCPVIRIHCTTKDDKAELTFTDNGKGLDMTKNGPNLFGLYKRFDPTVNGKGFGLYIVKTQVEALGGTIAANSQPNQGMQIIVTLPTGN
jgi:PAS domain S-box-containing protein